MEWEKCLREKRVTKKIKKIDNDCFIIQRQFIVTYAFNVIVKIRGPSDINLSTEYSYRCDSNRKLQKWQPSHHHHHHHHSTTLIDFDYLPSVSLTLMPRRVGSSITNNRWYSIISIPVSVNNI